MIKGSIFNESAAVAQVDFRVRCETLSHGEEVLLVRSDDPNLTSVSTTCTPYDVFRVLIIRSVEIFRVQSLSGTPLNM